MKALFYRDMIANKGTPLGTLVMVLLFLLIGAYDSPSTPWLVLVAMAVTYLVFMVGIVSLTVDKQSHADRYYLAAPLSPRIIVGQRFLSIYGATAVLMILYLVLMWIYPVPFSPILFTVTLGLAFVSLMGISTAIGYATGPKGFAATGLILCFGGVAIVFFLAKLQWFHELLEELVSLSTDRPIALSALVFLLMVIAGWGCYRLSLWVYRRTAH